MHVAQLERFVLTGSNIGMSAEFYSHVLEMIQKVVFTRGRVALTVGSQKIN